MKTNLAILFLMICIAATVETMNLSKHRFKPGVNAKRLTDPKCRELYNPCPLGTLCCDGLACASDGICVNDYEQALQDKSREIDELVRITAARNEEKRKRNPNRKITRTRK